MPPLSASVPEAAEVFEKSLARSLSHGDFVGSFYEIFMGSSELVREKFSGTDLEKQKKILKASLFLVARAALGMEDGVEHLEGVAKSHSRRKLDISPSLYALWLDCLVTAARRHDPQFTADVEAAWRCLLGWSVGRMVEVYRAEQTLPPPVRVAPRS